MSAIIETRVYPRAGGEISLSEIDFGFSWQDHVQGYVSLTVNDVNLLGAAESDTIDSLWALMVTLLESYQSSGSGVLYFPERSYSLTLNRINETNLLVRTTGASRVSSVVGDGIEVLKCLRDGAVEFFSEVLKNDPVDEWTYLRDLRRARALM